jgi:hypothetical protein
VLVGRGVWGNRRGVRGRRPRPYVLDVLVEDHYPVVHGPRLVERHIGRYRGPHQVDRGDDTCDPLVGRRYVEIGAPVGGGVPATLDGGCGESGGGVKMSLTHGCGAIADSYGPSTARGTHRGRAPALNLVLTVSSIVVDPNNIGDIGGDRDLGAGRRHS